MSASRSLVLVPTGGMAERAPSAAAAATAAKDRTIALIDHIESVLPTLTDEHVMWLIGFLQTSARNRPFDPRDPWSMLLRRSDCELQFIEGEFGGLTERLPDAPRYVVSIDCTPRRQRRRAVLAHELAHIELDNFYELGIIGSAEHAAIELETDVAAVARFDIDPAQLGDR